MHLRAAVVLDGCELDEEMLQRVRQILRTSGGDVLLLRALEPRLALDPLEDPLADEASRAEGGRYLRDIAQRLALGSVNVTIKVTTGLRKSEAIADTERQCEHDLILVVHPS